MTATRVQHRFGLDHPTWPHPDAFFYDSEQQAREAVLKMYGPDSGHVILEAMPVTPAPLVVDPPEHDRIEGV